ncbi:MAG: SAM-dependent methyltransferase [Clostridiales bacterium]|nr:SAM-dependent methyltransferase [Clostridiales bacterium]
MQQLSVRLESVFELVRESRSVLEQGRVIDIGSDHGFLSVRCLEEGVSDFAVCTDIHEAPAQKSKGSLIMAGFKDKFTVMVTDGMNGIDLQPNDIVVTAGMGGLNIIDIFTRIINDSDDQSLKRCGYVIQSQKSTHLVRRFFAERGFIIANETVCKDRGFFYNVMRLEYTGIPYELSMRQSYYGPCLLKNGDDLTKEYFAHLDEIFAVRARGDEDIRSMLEEEHED